MAVDATGTPTSRGIPKYNTAVDPPSGRGFNAAMDAIDALFGGHVEKPAGILSGEFAVWNGTDWERSLDQPPNPSSLGSSTPTGTTFLRGDGVWAEPPTPPTGAMTLIFDHVPNGTSGTVDSNTILGGDLPTTYTHLKAIIRYAHDSTSGGSCMVRFNNNAAAAYSYTYALMQGASITSNEVLLQTWGFLGTEFAAPAGWGANSPATAEVLFPFYRDTSIYRNYQFEGMRYNAGGGANAIIHRNGSGIWRASDPIGRIQFLSTIGNWSNQARITLYGIS